MWLNLRSEFSFGSTFGPIELVVERISRLGGESAGVADINSTWGHIRWMKACKKKNIKPIFGVQIAVVERIDLKVRRQPYDVVTFIALNNKGLNTIYKLVDKAHIQFYYKPILSYCQLNNIDEKNVAMIGSYSPRLDLMKRHMFLSLSPSTPLISRNIKGIDYIACCDNWYIEQSDIDTYEGFADERLMERKTTAMHILSDKEWGLLLPRNKQAIKNRNKLLKIADATPVKAKMLKFTRKADLKKMCLDGAVDKGIPILKNKYKNRLKKELQLIKDKNYKDYFLVVADMVNNAKKKMLVGHSRGSSAGSLVCYLLGITEIDPIKYDLVFERFIDVNRFDLPDIDIDFQDNKRHLVFKYAEQKYKKENVAQLGNISRLKSKSSIIRFSKALHIPPWETEELKDSIAEKSSGDERSGKTILDCFDNSEIGREFVKAFPQMMNVVNIENHASHTSVHAAGLIISNKPISNYCGINSRKIKGKENRIAMIDKKDAEEINLLKIDALGLITLTVIAETCDSINKPYEWVYTIKPNNKKVFKLFNEHRFNGLFQFEGDALQGLAKKMPIESIYDISALGALARPGPLGSGSAEKFVKRRSGNEPTSFVTNHPAFLKEVEQTHGVIVYQEQVMNIAKNYGLMSWEDVSELRRIIGKSLGDEAFGKYRKKFLKGAVKNGSKRKEASLVWKQMESMGGYAFNKSHAISYAMITYVCAYLKVFHPLEFAVASLNNTKNDRNALKLLRDLRENEGIKHKAFSKKNSIQKWSIYKGKLLGGFLTLDGLGPVKANQAVSARNNNTPLPQGIANSIEKCDTPFKYLYPANQLYGEYYLYPEQYGIEDRKVSNISELTEYGDYCIIGCLINKVVRDVNEAVLVSMRGGSLIEGSTTYLNLFFEDDTAHIFTTIDRKDFEHIGKEISENGTIDKDWYLIFGTYSPKWNKLYIKNIRRITK